MYKFNFRHLREAFKYILGRTVTIKEIACMTQTSRKTISCLFGRTNEINIGYQTVEKVLNYFIILAVEHGIDTRTATQLVTNMVFIEEVVSVKDKVDTFLNTPGCPN